MTEEKRIGRPRKPAGEKRVAVSVSLSPVERDELRATCERLNITQSELMRWAVENADLLKQIAEAKGGGPRSEGD